MRVSTAAEQLKLGGAPAAMGAYTLTQGLGAVGGVGGFGGGREVVVDRVTRTLVDVGSGHSNALTGYQYTTLEQSLSFIRAYRPAALASQGG